MVSVVGIANFFLEFIYVTCPYHEDVINVSVINSRLTWKVITGCSVSRCNRQSEFTVLHFMIFH